MCGIAGQLNREAQDPGDLERAVSGMSGCLRHRGPDSTGLWRDPGNTLALGFSRLAIQDLSPAANQPMLSESGRYAIVYNGEIYNADELSERIGRPANSFRTHSDTEVLLAAVEKLGLERTLQAANGMWALALWDTVERRLALARDRLGKKPLHYSVQNGVCRFASEIKGLLATGGARPALSREALEAYFALTYIPAPLSIFEGIRKVEPGHIVTVDADLSISDRTYWSLRGVMEERAGKPVPSYSEALEQADAMLQDAVRRRLVSDVPVGVLLSGGVDSSLVAGILGRKLQVPLQSFTIALEDERLDESRQAQAVASVLGVPNIPLKLFYREALGLVDAVVDSLDEPFGDYSAIPTHAVCKLARSQVTVLLGGDGGDEVFGGYPRYVWAQGWRGAAAGLYARWRAGRLTSPPWRAAEETYRRLMTTGAAGGSMEASRLDELAGGLGQIPGLSALRALRYLDFQLYLPDDILVKTDRMSMASSIELRSPFLDYRLVEMSWGLPDPYLVRKGTRKRITRDLFSRQVGAQHLQQTKYGFGLPMAAWLAGPLRQDVESAMQEVPRRLALPVSAEAVAQWWRGTQRGDATAAHRLWLVYALWRWDKRWNRSGA